MWPQPYQSLTPSHQSSCHKPQASHPLPPKKPIQASQAPPCLKRQIFFMQWDAIHSVNTTKPLKSVKVEMLIMVRDTQLVFEKCRSKV